MVQVEKKTEEFWLIVRGERVLPLVNPDKIYTSIFTPNTEQSVYCFSSSILKYIVNMIH
jgi:hypothetical protein